MGGGGGIPPGMPGGMGAPGGGMPPMLGGASGGPAGFSSADSIPTGSLPSGSIPSFGSSSGEHTGLSQTIPTCTYRLSNSFSLGSQHVKRAGPPGMQLPPDVKPNIFPPFQSASRISLLGSLPSLFMGLSNFISVPISLAIGRRLMLIIMMAILTGACIWGKYAATFDHHLAARCLIGLGAGSFESLSPLIIYDIFFTHQRGTAIGAMWSFSGMFSFVFGIMCSEIVTKIGWRWLYGIFACLNGAALLGAILFVPETRYLRSVQSLSLSHICALILTSSD